jgi:hypothetical protein
MLPHCTGATASTVGGVIGKMLEPHYLASRLAIPSTDCCAESATSVPYREELSDSYRSVQLTLRGKPALR